MSNLPGNERLMTLGPIVSPVTVRNSIVGGNLMGSVYPYTFDKSRHVKKVLLTLSAFYNALSDSRGDLMRVMAKVNFVTN